ncbi:MAG: hypothetical protein RQ899_05435 [Pseudomonadales bacterium]|nr:hypothetical protein [Pseudomonadales bacterium]
MRSKHHVLAIGLFLLSLLLLQQGIVLLDRVVPAFGTQAGIIMERDIDPAALFYTQSPLALNAEKKIRKSLTAD